VPLDIADPEVTIAKGDDGINGGFAAAKLLRRMLRHGISRYEPEPLKALAAAKRAKDVRTTDAPEPVV
jgi:hypothetical protein